MGGMFAEEDWETLCRDYPCDFGCPAGGLTSGERRQGTESRKGSYIDDWGVRWEVCEDGVAGEVKEPIIAEWSVLNDYNCKKDLAMLICRRSSMVEHSFRKAGLIWCRSFCRRPTKRKLCFE